MRSAKLPSEKMHPCPHPGRFHLSSDRTRIILPHPQAQSCFAREQGYVVAKIEPAYLVLGESIVEAMNKAPRCMWSTPDRQCVLPNEHGDGHKLAEED